jgi:SAM-dependent methyltransferase
MMTAWVAVATTAMFSSSLGPSRVSRPIVMAGGTQTRKADFTSNRARRSRFQSSSSGPDLVIAPNTKVYRGAAAALVKQDDVVLECGCQLGETTALLAERASEVIGIDMDRSLDKKSNWGGAYRAHATAGEAGLPDNTRLHIVDPHDLLGVQELCQNRGVSVLMLDANDAVGNDLPLDLLALCRQLSRVLSPSIRVLIVKSRALDRLRGQLVTAVSLTNEDGSALAEMSPSSAWPLPVPPLRSGLVRIVAAMGVAEYRAAAQRLLRPGWRVLELGCHTGTSTSLLAEVALARSGFAEEGTMGALAGGPDVRCVGVDVSSSIVDRARALHPTVTAFEVCDAWDLAGLMDVARKHLSSQTEMGKEEEGHCKNTVPEMLLLDVGGLSGAHGELDTLALVRALTSTFSPTLKAVVVKSHCLRTIALQFQSGYAVARTVD